MCMVVITICMYEFSIKKQWAHAGNAGVRSIESLEHPRASSNGRCHTNRSQRLCIMDNCHGYPMKCAFPWFLSFTNKQKLILWSKFAALHKSQRAALFANLGTTAGTTMGATTDAMTDAKMDTTTDAPTDARTDATMDARRVATVDGAMDATTDATMDARMDTTMTATTAAAMDATTGA